MPNSKSDQSQWPREGTRCLATPVGYWAPGIVHRVNEDGTFTVEFDDQDKTVMPYWFGITVAEISFHDEALWPNVFRRLTLDTHGMTKTSFANALSLAGYQVEDEKFDDFWSEQCNKLFHFAEDNANDAVLNEEQAYQLILQAGCSAKRLDQASAANATLATYFKLYWNQTRMGGRDPAEVCRPVTLNDAFLALGVADSRADRALEDQVFAYQQDHGILLPDNLARFLTRQGIARAVHHSHPNNPELVLPGDDYCVLHCNPAIESIDADYALTIMSPHQGDFVWAAVFSQGDDDARVYLMEEGEQSWDESQWALTAPTIGMFFWDLAQTGLAWFQDTGFEGGKAVNETDIGLMPRGKG